MPSEKKTPFLNLHQWEGSDKFCRDDFNKDNVLIDDACLHLSEDISTHKQNPDIHLSSTEKDSISKHISDKSLHMDAASLANSLFVVGSYAGDNQENQFINLGFDPSFVVAFAKGRIPVMLTTKTTETVISFGFCCKDGGSLGLSPAKNGFNAHSNFIFDPHRICKKMNHANISYGYIAFK